MASSFFSENICNHIDKESMRDVYRINHLISGLALIFSFSYLLLDHYKTPFIGLKSGFYLLVSSYCQSYILVFCARRYSLEPKKFKTYRYLLGFGSGIALYFLSWVIFSPLTGIIPHFNELRWMIIYTMIALFLNFIIFTLHDFVIFRRAKIQADMENYRLQLKNSEAQNLILKQQIQPHFLFNALSTMKVLYRKDTQMGEDYLFHLSDFLRASISETKNSLSTLAQELEICRNYLEMQQIRFGNSLAWTIDIKQNGSLGKTLPSFSLQPLLENAIKHNTLTSEKPLKISIRQNENTLEIENNINPKNTKEHSLGSGLSNLAERYQLLTGEDIEVQQNKTIFRVTLNFIPS